MSVTNAVHVDVRLVWATRISLSPVTVTHVATTTAIETTWEVVLRAWR